MASVPSLHGKKMDKQWKQWQILFWGGSKITADGDCSHEIKRRLLTPCKESYDQPRQHIKKQRHHFADKVYSIVSIVKAIFFPKVIH